MFSCVARGALFQFSETGGGHKSNLIAQFCRGRVKIRLQNRAINAACEKNHKFELAGFSYGG
jgi:hypothetical protein